MIAVYGSPLSLSAALASCAFYWRRLKQSSVVLVLVEAAGRSGIDHETEAWRGAAVKAEADGCSSHLMGARRGAPPSSSPKGGVGSLLCTQRWMQTE